MWACEVLGYKYSILEDTLQISGSSIDLSVNTKRGILTQTAMFFNPLSLCLPVTIQGKEICVLKSWGGMILRQKNIRPYGLLYHMA